MVSQKKSAADKHEITKVQKLERNCFKKNRMQKLIKVCIISLFQTLFYQDYKINVLVKYSRTSTYEINSFRKPFRKPKIS